MLENDGLVWRRAEATFDCGVTVKRGPDRKRSGKKGPAKKVRQKQSSSTSQVEDDGDGETNRWK